LFSGGGRHAEGLVTLDWTLQAAGAGPRFERWVRLTEDGRATARSVAAGERLAGLLVGHAPSELSGPRKQDVDGCYASNGG